MEMVIASGYRTSGIVASLPTPKREGAEPAKSSKGFPKRGPATAALVPLHPGTAAAVWSLLTLSTQARQEARMELRALALLWTTGWLALVLAFA
jgi:hypothetical protein